MQKVIHIRVPDLKVNGEWLSYHSTYNHGVQTLRTSESRHLFNRLVAKCTPTSYYTTKFPTYADCSNGFENFQQFAEWCNSTEGYGERYNGKLWCLDKDVLIQGNKMYSPERCCFIPEFVNNFFVIRGRGRGAYPVGVTKAGGRSKRYTARCNNFSGREALGNFITPMGAHMAWIEAKMEHLLAVIKLYSSLTGSRKDVVTSLEGRYTFLNNHLKSGTEVTYL